MHRVFIVLNRMHHFLNIPNPLKNMEISIQPDAHFAMKISFHLMKKKIKTYSYFIRTFRKTASCTPFIDGS